MSLDSPSARSGLACCLALALAACGGSSSVQGGRDDAASEPATAQKSARKPNTQKRGGAYYKDDGPADEIPVDLDAIPDAEPRVEPLRKAANKPYVVLGKSYVPNTTLQPYQKTGVASWYGKKFHGQKTSIGDTYDMFAMTAAHPTLALPSYARVTNVSNGKSVVVRITDRGPFLSERIIDLSYAAAHRLGYVDHGSTKVEVRSILPGEITGMTYAQVKPPDPPSSRPARVQEERDEIEAMARQYVAENAAPTPTSAAIASAKAMHGVYLQLGAFSSADNAESLRARFSRELDWLNEGVQINTGGGIHRVQVGPYANRAEAEKVAEKFRSTVGQKPTILTR